MKLTRRAALAALFAGIALPAGAYVIGGTNLGIMGYPDPTCRPPIEPYATDDYSRMTYRNERADYVQCVNDYIENGDYDIKRIQEAQKDALRDAKRNLGQ